MRLKKYVTGKGALFNTNSYIFKIALHVICKYYNLLYCYTCNSIGTTILFLHDIFLAGFAAHDPMVRKLPTRRFVDYPQKNRYQVTI